MSRGLGRIERAILAQIEREKQSNERMLARLSTMQVDPSLERLLDQHMETERQGAVLVSSWYLLCDLYSPKDTWSFGWAPSNAQRKAVTRAMHSFVRKFPQYALMGGQGRKRLYLYEPANPVSAMWAKLTVERRKFVSRVEAEAAVVRAAATAEQQQAGCID